MKNLTKNIKDRSIVENYFGSLCMCSNALSTGWTWSESFHDENDFMCITVAKCLAGFHLLPAKDGKKYNKQGKRLETNASERAKKRRRTQVRYKERGCRRTEVEYLVSGRKSEFLEPLSEEHEL